MHPNPAFRKADAKANINFARQRGFGTLAINSDNGPLLSHVPFVLSEDGKMLEAHLVRSNPILKHISQAAKAVMSVLGPHSYISPDWYENDNQVPTWNYIAVHIRGELMARPEDELRPMLEKLSDQFESRLLPKAPWLIDKVDEEALKKMTRMIVPIRMQVSDIEGTWKLAQNKPPSARINAANQVREYGLGAELEDLAGLMKNPPN